MPIVSAHFRSLFDLLKAKGPIGHLHRSKIHYIKYINTHKHILSGVTLKAAKSQLRTATLGLRTTAAGREFQMSTMRLEKNETVIMLYE